MDTSTYRDSEKKFHEQIRWEQWQAQVAALSCEVTLNAIRKGLKNTVKSFRSQLSFNLIVVLLIFLFFMFSRL